MPASHANDEVELARGSYSSHTPQRGGPRASRLQVAQILCLPIGTCQGALLVGISLDRARAFSGEVDPVHRRKCVGNKDESRFRANGNGSSVHGKSFTAYRPLVQAALHYRLEQMAEKGVVAKAPVP